MKWPEDDWERLTDYVELSREAIEALIDAPVQSAKILSSGKANTNYRVDLDDRTVVLRLYEREAEACAREQRLYDLVAGAVPVPRWLGMGQRPDGGHYALLEHIEGTHPQHADAAPFEIGYRLGAGLRALESVEPPNGRSRLGLFAPDLSLSREFPSVADSFVDLIDWSLREGRARKRLGPLRETLSARLDDAARSLEPLEDWRGLTHGDYKWSNVLLRDGQLAAVLDWEFACPFTPMLDVAIHMRHRESFGADYIRGFVEGHGALPDDWQRLSRVMDLMNLTGFLNASGERPTVYSSVLKRIAATLNLL